MHAIAKSLLGVRLVLLIAVGVVLCGSLGCSSGATSEPPRPTPSDPQDPDDGSGGAGGDVDGPGDQGGDENFAPSGPVGVQLDGKLRPIEVSSENLRATFTWSADSSQVEINVDAAGQSHQANLAVDFSDATLVQAIADADLAGDGSYSDLSNFVESNPGDVAGFVRTVVRRSFGNIEVRQIEPFPAEVQALLTELTRTELIIRATALAIEDGIESNAVDAEAVAVLDGAAKHLLAAADDVHFDLGAQRRACTACTSVCRVRCTPSDNPLPPSPIEDPPPLPPDPPTPSDPAPPIPGGGSGQPPVVTTFACCFASANGTDLACDDVATEQECLASPRRGTPHAGILCSNPNLVCNVGACCSFILGQHVCRVLTRADCERLDAAQLADATFFEGQNCCDEEVLTFCGADPRCE